MAKKFSDAVKAILSSGVSRAEGNAAIKNLIELADSKDPRIEDDRAPRSIDHKNLLPAGLQGDGAIPSMLRGAGKAFAKTGSGLFNSKEVNKELDPVGGYETAGGIGADIVTTVGAPMLGAAKKASTSAKILNTAGNAALQSGLLSTAKGNDVNTVKNEAITGGAFGGALRGLPALAKEGIPGFPMTGAKSYIRKALRGTDIEGGERLIEDTLDRVLQTVPKAASSANSGPARVRDWLKSFLPANENMSPNSILKQSDVNFRNDAFNESDIAAKLNGSVLKDRVIDIFKEGTEGAMVPSARVGRLGNRNVDEFTSDNFVERYKNSGKHLEDIIEDYFNRSNPETIAGSTTRNAVDKVDSPLFGMKWDIPRKETVPFTKKQYFDPVTDKFARMDKRRPQEMSLEDTLSMARNLEITKPTDISKSINPLYTPTQSPNSRNAVEGLFDELGKYPELAKAITKTDNEVIMGRMIKKLFGGQEEVENLLPYARGVSGLTHNNLPYAGMAALSASKPLKIARQVNKNADDFTRTILPKLLKMVPALSQSNNRE